MDFLATEHTAGLRPSAATERPGEPVFVSASGNRERALRLGARAVVALVILWLVALLAGALGLGRLPGVPLPDVGKVNAPPAHAAAGKLGPSSAAHRPKAASAKPARGKRSRSPATTKPVRGKRSASPATTKPPGGQGRRGSQRQAIGPRPPMNEVAPTRGAQGLPGSGALPPAAASPPATTVTPGRSGTAPGSADRPSGPPATGKPTDGAGTPSSGRKYPSPGPSPR